MIRVRLRYPLLLIGVGILYAFAPNIAEHTPLKSTLDTNVVPHPHLDAGYYIVLHTKATLPDELCAKQVGKKTYVGPLPTIRECHESRTKIKPLYPGIASELIKVNTIPEE